jgi:hypothetical protein
MMKNFNDNKIYLYFAITTLAIALIIGAISYYSVLVVEPRIDALLSKTEDVNQNYKDAYRMLRDAEIFARYQNFDPDAASQITAIQTFDRKIYTGDEFIDTDMRALESLLERRAKGSRLGRTTMFFFLIISAMGWGAFFWEKRQMAKA